MVLQQTALERTLCRIYSLGAQQSSAGVSAAARLLDEIATAAAAAVATQKELAHAPDTAGTIQRDTTGYWAQITLVRRLMDMPLQVHAAPMFQSTRHYAI